MAYDHNFKKTRNAKKAAEETFEPKSKRDKRLLSVSAKKATWLAMLFLAGASIVIFVVIDHFGSQGVRSEQQEQVKGGIDDAQQPRPQAAITDPLQKLMATSEQVSGQELPKAESPVREDQTVLDASANIAPATVVSEGEPDKKAPLQSATPSKPLKNSDPEASSAQMQEMPVRSLNDLTGSTDDSSDNLADKKTPVITAFSVPQKEDFEAEMTFYDELAKQEVVVDKTAKQPIMFDKPYYILAGSFSSEARAIRERDRLRKQGQELKIVKVGSIYQLETEPYYNSLKFGARKNALSKVGASVAKRLARKATPEAK